jgi:hypothetical protein
MNFSFDFANKNNIVSIRLDTFSGNPYNNIFYAKLGFKNWEKYILESKVTNLFIALRRLCKGIFYFCTKLFKCLIIVLQKLN